MADLVHELVRELGLTEVTLVGQDVGGMIAFSYLRRFPARAAVIMNTVIPGVDPWDDVIRNPWLWHFAFHSIPELPERLVSADRGAYFDYFFDAIAASPESIDHAARARYADAYESPEALHQGFEFYRALWSDARENQTHVAVAAPLLYLRGSHERGDIDAYAGGLARSGFTSVTTAHIEGAGHFDRRRTHARSGAPSGPSSRSRHAPRTRADGVSRGLRAMICLHGSGCRWSIVPSST